MKGISAIEEVIGPMDFGQEFIPTADDRREVPASDAGHGQETMMGSREIIQSYILTTARYDFNVYEKRILYQLVRFAQSQIDGISFKDNIHLLEHSLTGAIQLLFPITDFLTGKDDKNNRRIKKALIDLSNKKITYQEKNDWGHVSLIANPHIWNEKGQSWVRFIVDGKVWDAILDFSKGYSKFYFDVAFSLKSVYSMRLYELLGSQENSICYSIDEIRKIFELDGEKDHGGEESPKGKYRNTNDLIRKVIEPAKKELDQTSPVTFRYETQKKGRKITSILFTPVSQKKKLLPKADFNRSVRKYGTGAVLNRDERRILGETGFTDNGIRNNLDIFLDAKVVLDDFLMEITLLKGQARSKQNPCGWFIKALRGKVDDRKSKKKKL